MIIRSIAIFVALAVLSAPTARSQSGRTTGAEFSAFVEMLSSLQGEIEDFQCEFEGTYRVTIDEVRKNLKLSEDGLLERYSGIFVWMSQGDTSVDTLHKIEPDGVIERERLIIRQAKGEAEHYVRRDDAPFGRALVTQSWKINTNRKGCLGSIFLIDTIRRYSTMGDLNFSVSEDSREGTKLKLVTIAFVKSATPYQKFWIDMARGGHVVRWESFAPGGDLIGLATIQLSQYRLGDSSVWMPSSGVIETHSGFKDGKPFYPKEPTSVEKIYVVRGTMEFNKKPNKDVFTIKYKPGTPISDNFRKLEYEFGQQKSERGPTKAEAEKELEARIREAEEQKDELVVPQTDSVGGTDWLLVGFVGVVLASTAFLWVERRRR